MFTEGTRFWPIPLRAPWLSSGHTKVKGEAGPDGAAPEAKKEAGDGLKHGWNGG